MKNFLISLLVCGAFSLGGIISTTTYITLPPSPQINTVVVDRNIVKEIMDAGVKVKTKNGWGAGTLITKKVTYNGKEDLYNFVLTCGHVVESMIVDGVMDDSSLEIVQPIIFDKKQIGEKTLKGKVLKYSGGQGKDIAVILILNGKFNNTTPNFNKDLNWSPEVGDVLFHVGSPSYEININSFLVGHMSFLGRHLNGQTMHQVQLGISGGCSGGGIFTEKGEFSGMAARSYSESLSFMIPIREIKVWLNSQKMSWLTDDSSPPKNLEDIL